MSDVVVVVPVLKRPHRVLPVMDAFSVATPEPYRLLFVASPTDLRELRALEAADAEWIVRDGGYAFKVNEAVEATDEPLLFFAADDLEPQEGWLEAAKAKLTGRVEVVGVNDLIERSRPHTTHFLVGRVYASQPAIDGNRGPLCEFYDHSYVDDELIATAKKRGVYAYADDSHVRHLHPDNGTAGWDETYRKGRARMHADRQIFRARVPLWT